VVTGRRRSPRENVRAECARRGERELVAGCVTLLAGGQVDDALLTALGGESAQQIFDGLEGGRSGYWPRVWGARALLYAWDPPASAAIVGATADPHWRVREMVAKVIAHRLVGEGLGAVAGLRDDPVPRVRSAAERALVALTAAGA
jgi:hypothetical protein